MARKVRVVKVDNRYWGVEKLEDGEWKHQGLYCLTVDSALNEALKLGMPNGEYNEAMRIFNETKKQIEVVK